MTFQISFRNISDPQSLYPRLWREARTSRAVDEKDKPARYVTIDPECKIDGISYKISLAIEKAKEENTGSADSEPIAEAKLSDHPIIFITEQDANLSSCTFHVLGNNKVFFDYVGTHSELGMFRGKPEMLSMLVWLEGELDLETNTFSLYTHNQGTVWVDSSVAPNKDDLEARVTKFITAFCEVTNAIPDN